MLAAEGIEERASAPELDPSLVAITRPVVLRRQRWDPGCTWARGSMESEPEDIAIRAYMHRRELEAIQKDCVCPECDERFLVNEPL